MRKIYLSIAVAVLTLFLGFSHSDVSGNFLFTENIENYYKMGIWNEQSEFGVRIGGRVIRHEIYIMKDYDFLRVDNTRIEAMRFRYRGLDSEENNLKLKYRVELTKHNKQVWAGSSSRYISFENTWDVWMALNLRVEDGEFAYKPILTKTDKGYRDVPDWWLDDMVKRQFELFGLIAQNDSPDKQTEIILRWPYKISNLGRYYDDIMAKNRCVAQLRKSGVIKEKDIRIDKKGVWFVYSYDPENFDLVHDLAFRDTCSIDNVMASE